MQHTSEEADAESGHSDVGGQRKDKEETVDEAKTSPSTRSDTNHPVAHLFISDLPSATATIVIVAEAFSSIVVASIPNAILLDAVC